MSLRKSHLKEHAALLLPARFAKAAPACNIPVCSLCKAYCKIDLVETGRNSAKVLVTCFHHKSNSGHNAEQLMSFDMTDDEWTEEDLGKLIRGVRWFEDSIRHEDLIDV